MYIFLSKIFVIELTWTVLLQSYMFCMNVDKWAWCGQFLLINELEVVLCYIEPRIGHMIV